MLPLHQYLPRIQEAVRLRIADPTVDQMSESDLRILLYQVVDNYERKIDTYERHLADPDALFDAMIDAANETVEEFRDASSEAASTRAQVLTRLLQLVSRALNAVGGPVRSMIARTGGQQFVTPNPLIRGIQMATSKRPRDSKSRTIAYHSWWIVTLNGDTDCPDARWARVEHRGKTQENGDSEEFLEVNLVTSLDVAEATTRTIVASMLAAFIGQLKNISGPESKLLRMTEEDRDLVVRMESALVAMGPV